ncbi:MAG: hypothetical protein ACREJO_02815 [Phycisphaerales bacterium]
MSLVIVGMDEAGYGPMLGPLTVGMSAIRVGEWMPGETAPDLWKVLAGGVCRKGGDKRGRIAVEDSKKLKLANDSVKHPLLHLEAGVLAMLRCMDRRPETDAELLNLLGVRRERHEWYGGEPMAMPLANDGARLGVRANGVALALAKAGCELLDVRVAAVGEGAFNETVRQAGTKAAATAIGLASHMTQVWDTWSRTGEGAAEGGPRVVCDRQGGRADYAAFIHDTVVASGGVGVAVEVLEQGDIRSRYRVCGRGADGAEREMTLIFQVEAEGACMMVALASMAAKLVRELMMARFNRYWSARAAERGIAELKPTAGYVQDARRWLRDAAPLLSSEARRTMVRIA